MPSPRSLVAALAAITLTSVASAQVSLGAAAQYTLLTVPGDSTLNISAAGVIGDVGVGTGGHIALFGSSQINGDVFLSTTIAQQFTVIDGGINGTVLEHQASVDTAIADAVAASNTAAALAPTQSFGSIFTNTTVFGNGGLNVVQINGDVNLNNASLLFFGGPSDIFIVNVSGTMILNGSGFVSPSAGTWDTHVLLNFTGSGTITSTGHPTVNATILAPHQTANLSGTFGSIYAGASLNVGLFGAAKVHATPFVPTPGSVSILLAAGLFAARRRRNVKLGRSTR